MLLQMTWIGSSSIEICSLYNSLQVVSPDCSGRVKAGLKWSPELRVPQLKSAQLYHDLKLRTTGSPHFFRCCLYVQHLLAKKFFEAAEFTTSYLPLTSSRPLRAFKNRTDERSRLKITTGSIKFPQLTQRAIEAPPSPSVKIHSSTMVP